MDRRRFPGMFAAKSDSWYSGLRDVKEARIWRAFLVQNALRRSHYSTIPCTNNSESNSPDQGILVQ